MTDSQKAPQVILVALDLTYMDQLLLQYLQFVISKSKQPTKVIGYHNIRFDYLDQINDVLQGLDQPLTHIIEKEIQELFSSHLPKVETEVVIEQENDTASAIIERQKKNKIDLLVFGKKSSYDGSGYLIERIMYQKPKANLLIVPETASHHLSSLLVPVDFSKKSAKAVLMGQLLGEAFSAQLSCQHVYSFPQIYFPYLPVEDLKKKVDKELKEAWAKFKGKYLQSTEIEDVTFSFHADQSISQMIYHHALQKQIDMIVVPSETKLINSTVIHLLKTDLHIPIFIVSDAG